VITQVDTPAVGLPACRFPDAQFVIVDDDEAAVQSLARILRAAGYRAISTTTDSREVDALVEQSEPDLVLLDVHMPERDGIAVVQRLRATALPQTYLPVLMLTGDPSQTVRRRALAAGATDFVMKPFEIDEVLFRIGNLLEMRYLHRELRRHSHSLELRVAARTAELDAAHLDTLKRLALAAEFRDDETGRHTERVGEIAGILATALGLPDEDARLLRRAAPLHDVGKIGIPDSILRKPGPLTEAEWVTMKLHTTIGARLLAGGQSRIVRLAEQIALTHHEHWNGLGYPRGLVGETIPLAGRIVMVADVFDALLSDRVYRTAWGVERVFTYISGHAGQRFDPRIAALCDVPAVRDALVSTHDSQIGADGEAGPG
jgi:putative two-component system response regulator